MDLKWNFFIVTLVICAVSLSSCKDASVWQPKGKGWRFVNLLSSREIFDFYFYSPVGCHLKGYTRKISIPDCIEFNLTTNACHGLCESFAISSNFALGVHRADQPVTSVGQCCNMMDSEDVKVKVGCLEGNREFTFKSATSCSCHHCKKS